MTGGFKYRAFISYSHRDKQWGDWLLRGLERYRVPKRIAGTSGRDGAIPARLVPIFRDREELPSSADLGDQIRQALEQSAYLIVICSPNSARSRWVNEEILTFKRMGRENRILAVIVDGEPNAADKAQGDPGRECFPEGLKFRFGPDGAPSAERSEPIAADARPEGDGKENAKLKLIAGLLGIGFDALKQRELEAARRRARISQAIAASMLLLAFAAVAGGAVSWLTSVVAGQRLQAAQIAQSRMILEKAARVRPELAIPALLEALPRSVEHPDRPFVPEVAAQLAMELDVARDLLQLVPNAAEPIQQMRFAASGRTLIGVSGEGPSTVATWEIPSGRQTFRREWHEGIVDADLAPRARQLAFTLRVEGAPIHLIPIDGGEESDPLWIAAGRDKAVGLSFAAQAPDGAVVEVFGTFSELRFASVDPQSGRIFDVVTESCVARGMLGQNWLVPAGGLAVVWCDDGSVAVRRLDKRLNRVAKLQGFSAKPANAVRLDKVAASRSGRLLAIAPQGEGRVEVFSVQDGRQIAHIAVRGRDVRTLQFVGESEELFVDYTDGSADFVHADGTVAPAARTDGAREFGSPFGLAAIAASGERTLLAPGGGILELWQPREGKRIARIEENASAAVIALIAMPGGKGFVAARRDGTVEHRRESDGSLLQSWRFDGNAHRELMSSSGGAHLAAFVRDRICIVRLESADEPACRQFRRGVMSVEPMAEEGGFVAIADGLPQAIGPSPAEEPRALAAPEISTVLRLVKFDPTESRIAATSINNDVFVFDLKRGALERRIDRLGQDIEEIAFDRTGRFLAVRGRGSVDVFDLDDAKGAANWSVASSPQSMAFAGDALLVGVRNGTQAFALATGARLPERDLPADKGTAVGASADGTVILTQVALQAFAVWPPLAPHWSSFHEINGGLLPHAAISPDGVYVALSQLSGGMDASIVVRSSRDKGFAARLEVGGEVTSIAAAAFTADGAMLLVAREAGTVSLIDPATRVEIKTADCACGRPVLVQPSIAGDRVLVAGNAAAVVLELPSLAQLSAVTLLGTDPIWATADTELRTLALVGSSNVMLVSLPDGRRFDVTSAGVPSELIWIADAPLAWLARNGRRLALVRQSHLWVFDVASSKLEFDISIDGDVALGAIDDTGSALALSFRDHRLEVLDLDAKSNRFLLPDIPDLRSMTFSGPKNRQLLLEMLAGSAAVLDGRGSLVGVLKDPTGLAVSVEKVVPAGEQGYLGVVGGVDLMTRLGSAMVWDAETLVPAQFIRLDRAGSGPRLVIGRDAGLQIAVAPQGSRAFLFHDGSAASVVEVKTQNPQRIIDEACQRALHPLTAAERAQFFITGQDTNSRAERILAWLPAFLRGGGIVVGDRGSCPPLPN